MAANVVEVLVKSTNLTGEGFAQAKAGAEETAASMDTLAAANDRVTEASIKYAQAQGGLLDAQLKLADVEGKESATDAEIAAAKDKVTQATIRQADAQIALLNAEAKQEGAAAAAADANVAASDRTAAAAKVAGDAQKAQGDAALASGAKADTAGGLMAGMGGKLKMAGIGIAVGMGVAVDAAAKYQDQTTHLVTDAGESAKALGMVQQGMLAISAATGTSASEIDDAMYHVESAGFHGAQGLAVLKVAAEGAKVGGASLDTVGKSLTGTMNAYGMSSKNAGEQTRMSVSMMNQLIATTGAGDMKMQDLASSLGNVAPVAATAKIRFAEVGGAIATMTAQNMSADQATQDLRHTIVSLENPNAVQRKEMAALGLSASDLQQNLGKRGLSGTLEIVAAAAKAHAGALGQTYVQAVAKATGGTTGMNTALMLTGTHLETFKGNINTVAAAAAKGGTSVDNWSAIQGTFNFKMDQAKASIKDTGIALGSALLPAVSALLGPLARFLAVIASNKAAAVAFAVVIGGLLAGAIGVKAVKAVTEFKGAVESVAGGISKLVGKIAGIGDAQAAAAAASDAAAAEQEADAAAVATANDAAAAESEGSWLGSFATRIGAGIAWAGQSIATVATVVASNVAGAASAAGAWVAGAAGQVASAAVWVAGMVAKVALVVAGNVAGALTTAGAWMAANAVMLLGIGAVVALVVIAVVEIVKHWSSIVNGVKKAWDAVVHAVSVAVKAVVDFVKQHWQLLLAILLGPIAVATLEIAKHWKQIAAFAATLWHDVSGFVSHMWHDVTGFFANMWGDLERRTVTGVGNVVHWFEQLPGKIVSALGNVGSMLFSSGMKIVQGLINGIGSMIGSLGSTVENDVVGTIKSFLPFSPAKRGPLSGSGAPENSGKSIARLLAQGMSSGASGVRQAAAHLAASAGVSASGSLALASGGAGAAAGKFTFEFTGSGSDLFERWFRQRVRVIGGGNVQKAFGTG